MHHRNPSTSTGLDLTHSSNGHRIVHYVETVQGITQLLLYRWAFTLFPIFQYEQPTTNILGFLSGLGQKCYLSWVRWGWKDQTLRKMGMGALGCCPHSPVPHRAGRAAGKRLWRWRPPDWGRRQCHSKPSYRTRGGQLFCPGGDTGAKPHLHRHTTAPHAPRTSISILRSRCLEGFSYNLSVLIYPKVILQGSETEKEKQKHDL